MDQILEALEGLSPRARVAFAALCASRVHVIFKHTTQHDTVPKGPRIAIETAIAFATNEGAPDQARIDQAKSAVDLAFPPADDGGGPDHFSCAAAAYALDAIADATPRSAWLAAGRALDAIDQVDEEGGSSEEGAWQLQALKRLTLVGSAVVPSEVLTQLEDARPQWKTRFTS